MLTTLRRSFYKLIGKGPADMPMVQYWKTQQSAEAKVTKNREGTTLMYIAGEKEPFPGYPRGYLLFGKLSALKHEIKNQLFNASWAELEAGVPAHVVAKKIKRIILPRLFSLAEETRYDRVPFERMGPAVKEIYRAWTVAARGVTSFLLRELITFILQEDDAYRFRVQWLATYFNPNRWWARLLGRDPVQQFERALCLLEHAEVIGDMKERIRLLRRVLLVTLGDPSIQSQFLALCREVNWQKLRLSESDKFHFRAKYFKVDMDLFEY